MSHGLHGQSNSVETAVSGEDKMISIGLCQLPRQWFPARLSASRSVYYFVCFAPFAEEDGGQAADSHDRWQSVCVCLFSSSFFLREVTARLDQYSNIVLPPHLIQWEPWVLGVRLLIGLKH